MLAIVAAFVVFNLIVIIWDGVIGHCRKHCARRHNIFEFRMNRHKLSDLNRRALFAQRKLYEFHQEIKLRAKAEKAAERAAKKATFEAVTKTVAVEIAVDQKEKASPEREIDT